MKLTYLDHAISIGARRKSGFRITIRMPDGVGRVVADAEVTTPQQAQRVAVRIIETLTARKAETSAADGAEA